MNRGEKEPKELRVGRYRLGEQLGFGSFGAIYVGYHIDTGQQVAIKLEPLGEKYPQLAWEYRIYSQLSSTESYPRVYWFGQQDQYNALALELLGPSLEQVLRKSSTGTLKVNYVLQQLGQQMVHRIQLLHQIGGFVHRDIKPDNFLLGCPGTDREHTVFLIDFGLAKKYLLKDGSHIPFREGKSLTGTARYASLNNHRGYELSRRDDLEAILYVLIYLVRGNLPWQGQKPDRASTRYEHIYQRKLATSPEELCQGLPEGLLKYLKYIRALPFEAEPDYELLKSWLSG